jgi:hypothetical protein
MIERIDARRGELADRAEALRKELGEIEAELAELEAAGRVVARFLAEADAPGEAGSQAVVGGVIPHQGRGQLPADYARLWRFAATAPAPVTCKDACRELGLAFEPRLIEGVRVKLKRLVARGWLIEPAPGKFTAATPVALEAGA